jgi:hypothetical protein
VRTAAPAGPAGRRRTAGRGRDGGGVPVRPVACAAGPRSWSPDQPIAGRPDQRSPAGRSRPEATRQPRPARPRPAPYFRLPEAGARPIQHRAASAGQGGGHSPMWRGWAGPPTPTFGAAWARRGRQSPGPGRAGADVRGGFLHRAQRSARVCGPRPTLGASLGVEPSIRRLRQDAWVVWCGWGGQHPVRASPSTPAFHPGFSIHPNTCCGFPRRPRHSIRAFASIPAFLAPPETPATRWPARTRKARRKECWARRRDSRQMLGSARRPRPACWGRRGDPRQTLGSAPRAPGAGGGAAWSRAPASGDARRADGGVRARAAGSAPRGSLPPGRTRRTTPAGRPERSRTAAIVGASPGRAGGRGVRAGRRDGGADGTGPAKGEQIAVSAGRGLVSGVEAAILSPFRGLAWSRLRFYLGAVSEPPGQGGFGAGAGDRIAISAGPARRKESKSQSRWARGLFWASRLRSYLLRGGCAETRGLVAGARGARGGVGVRV